MEAAADYQRLFLRQSENGCCFFTRNMDGTVKNPVSSFWKKENHQFIKPHSGRKRGSYMAFFTSAITILQTLVVALGAGLAVWGVINLLEGYGNDNPGAKSQGIKQFMAN